MQAFPRASGDGEWLEGLYPEGSFEGCAVELLGMSGIEYGCCNERDSLRPTQSLSNPVHYILDSSLSTIYWKVSSFPRASSSWQTRGEQPSSSVNQHVTGQPL